MTSPQQLLEEYERRLATHRWEEVAPLIDEAAVFIFSEGTFTGKAIEAAFRRTFAAIEGEQYEITDQEWSVLSAEVAACHYKFRWQGRINGKPASGGGRGTSIVRRTSSGWKIVHEHLGPCAVAG